MKQLPNPHTRRVAFAGTPQELRRWLAAAQQPPVAQLPLLTTPPPISPALRRLLTKLLCWVGALLLWAALGYWQETHRGPCLPAPPAATTLRSPH